MFTNIFYYSFRLVGHFLCLSPEYCFVVEDETGICGYALAALDARQLRTKCEICWIPELQKKYPAPKKENGEMLTPAEVIKCFKKHSFVILQNRVDFALFFCEILK